MKSKKIMNPFPFMQKTISPFLPDRKIIDCRCHFERF